MLQFIPRVNERYTLAEQAQMAIEGGCQWIQLRFEDESESEIRDICTEIVALCKENGTILTVEDLVEVAQEMGMHGVHLRNSTLTPAQAREILGPEAIVGVEVNVASEAMPLQYLDIDYVTFAPETSLERLSENVEALRNDKFELPIVIEGKFNEVQAKEALRHGANGIAENLPIADAKDPVALTESILKALNE